MIGGKAQSRFRPTALGAMLQASTYGATIPNIYGMTKAAFLAIWMQNLRQGGSGKKFKNKKKGVTSYVANVDFLLGSNPIIQLMQLWENTTKLPLTFNKVSRAAGEYNLFTSYTVTDPHFYAVVAVTYSMNYSLAVNDYGGPGPSTLSGNFEIPCWNMANSGPDPSNPSAYTQWPWLYWWEPSFGNVVQLPTAFTGLPGGPEGVTALNVYYAATNSTLSFETPAHVLRLTFEPSLADGPEYTGDILGTSTPLSSQQVIMPFYAGAGSENFDLGASGARPLARPEVLGSFAVYPTGDADFADMIEDLVKSGLQQNAIGGTSPIGSLQHGSGCYALPGVTNKNILLSLFGGGLGSIEYPQPNGVGNILLAYHFNSTASLVTFNSTNETTNWNIIDSGTDAVSGLGWNLSWATAVGGTATNTVSIAGSFGNGPCGTMVCELLGVDTFDAKSASSPTHNPWTGQITTGNVVGSPALCVQFLNVPLATGSSIPDLRWAELFGPFSNNVNWRGFASFKNVWAPGVVKVSDPGPAVSGSAFSRLIIASFKRVNPSPLPVSFGNFIDKPSMDICRTQARAYGLYGSLVTQSQKACRDWLTDLYSSMNCAPFYSGNVLKQVPYGEVSTAGNGALYTAPTASGPIAALSDLNGDFITESPTDPPLTVKRKARFDAINVFQYQIPNRASDYNPVVVSQPESGSVALYGVRKGAPEDHPEIADTSVARTLLGIKCRDQAYILNTISAMLGPKGILFEPMDFVSLTESLNALSNFGARFTSVTVTGDFDDNGKASTAWRAQCQWEPYIWGVHGPSPVVAASLAPFTPNTDADPGAVNTPIIFEPVPRLYGSQSQGQLWTVVSGASLNYAGCYVYLSTDGGSSYGSQPIGAINGNGITGVTTNDWPIANDPDTTNNLGINLTESNGIISSYATADRDNFTYPCYIAGGNANIPYGLMTYNSETLTATSKYTLNATGAGNELRRCVFSAPVSQPGPDVDHPNGSRWAFLGNPAQPNAPGILKLTMDPKWIGVTLYFKFLPFNTFGNTVASLSGVTAYSFTPTGIPGGGIAQNQLNYVNTPAISLSQTSTTNLSMLQVSTKFPTNTVNYNARSTITIPTVVSPTWYYVYIIDPSYTGDTGAGTNLSVQVDTTQSHLGVPGYTYMGAIQALPSGFAGAIALPGGYPPPAANLFG